MRLWKKLSCVLAAVIAPLIGAYADGPIPPTLPDYEPPEIPRFSATTLRAYQAPEADQGAAVDADYFYAVDNSVIGKYAKSDGALVERWIGANDGPIDHLNSCFEELALLWCANSNYSETPMASSIEVFTTDPVDHFTSHSLGLMDEGSLTWFDRYRDGWLAAFAHYDGSDGGLAFKGHRFSGIVTFDERWRRTGGWMLPNSILGALAPDAASGGQIGPDGLLYITGHDKPEMYVLAKPKMGPKLVHLATLDIELEGQAFSWDMAAMRTLYAIDRREGLVRAIEIPEIPLRHENAERFRGE